jgi:hypothetical protein
MKRVDSRCDTATHSVTVGTGLDARTGGRLGVSGSEVEGRVRIGSQNRRLLVVMPLDVLLLVLFLDGRTIIVILFLLFLVLGAVSTREHDQDQFPAQLLYADRRLPDSSDGLSDGTVPLHLLAGNQVPGDQHPNVVPPLHHLVVAPSPESVGSLALAHLEQAASVARGLAISRSTVLASLDVEFVRLGSVGRRRRSKGTGGQEERPDGVGGMRGVRRSVLVQVTRGGEDVVALLVRFGESLLALEQTNVYGLDRRVVLTGVVDHLQRVGRQGQIRSFHAKTCFSTLHLRRGSSRESRGPTSGRFGRQTRPTLGRGQPEPW